MIYILEGPDGSGKTTLAEKLHKMTGAKIVHRSKPETDADKNTMFNMYLQNCATAENLILDRCWYSEMVYGKVMRDESVLSVYDMYSLEETLSKRAAMIIYCTGTRHELWERATRRGEDYITERKDFDKICDEYEKLFSIPHYIPVVRYTCPKMHTII